MLDQDLVSADRTGSSAPPNRLATFREILTAQARNRPDKQVFVFLDNEGGAAAELSFAALDERARAIAAQLVAKGLAGERVLLVFPPGLDFVAALFGCFYAGAVAVPIPYFAGKRVLERIDLIYRDASPAGVLTLRRLKEDRQLDEAFEHILTKVVRVETDALPQAPADIALPELAPDGLALLQYTSGSTSTPKGVMLSHANLVANSAMIAEAFGYDESSRGVGWLPLFHDMGLIGHVLQPVYLGAFSVLMSPLSFLQRPARWLRAISSWKASVSGGPTHAFDLCLRSVRDDQLEGVDLGSWSAAYCGSEKVQADVLDRFAARFASYGFRRQSLVPCFGLAEATLLVTGARRAEGIKVSAPDAPFDHVPPVAGCGTPARGTRVLVVDPESLTRLGDGAVGEVWVQGPHVGQGYWGVGEFGGKRVSRAPRRWLGPLFENRGSRLPQGGRIVRGRTHQEHDHR